MGAARISYVYMDDIKVMNLMDSVGDLPASGLLDASIAWTTADGDWRFALTESNLTDKEYRQSGYDFGSAIN